MSRIALLAALTFAAATGPALAHTGLEHAFGFAHGFAHPFGGVDHVLAMVAVGLLAAQIGGRALWALPLGFMTMMALGVAIGLAGTGLPFVETGIGLSIVAFGLAIAMELRGPVVLATGLVGLFAIFHGRAHGAEMPESASGHAYATGFVAATAILHAIGLALGLALGRASATRVVQAAGGAVAIAGLAILAKLV